MNAIEEAKKLAVALSRVTFASQAEYDSYRERFIACEKSIVGVIPDPRDAQTYDWLLDAWRAADRRSNYQFSTDAD
jgi:hypothetical protein